MVYLPLNPFAKISNQNTLFILPRLPAYLSTNYISWMTTNHRTQKKKEAATAMSIVNVEGECKCEMMRPFYILGVSEENIIQHPEKCPRNQSIFNDRKGGS